MEAPTAFKGLRKYHILYHDQDQAARRAELKDSPESPELHNGKPINPMEEERWVWANYILAAINELKARLGIKHKLPRKCK